jgi:hypothetical protein
MQLVYNFNNDPVKVGDMVTLSDGTEVEVHYFREPHKPESQGKVTVKEHGTTREYYCSIIGAVWKFREDRE